nr:polyprotein ORF1b [Porcupine nidovirus 2]
MTGQVVVDAQLPKVFEKILDDTDFEPPIKRYCFVSDVDCGYKCIDKIQTGNFTTANGEHYMIKFAGPKDVQRASQLRAKGLPVLPHRMINIKGYDLLIRGPTTFYSLGDYVYSFLMGESIVEIPDKANLDDAARKFADILRPSYDNMVKIKENIGDTPLPITLDNIDCNGFLYDFEDLGKGPNKFEVAMDDYIRYWSTSGQPLPDNRLLSVDYETLVTGTWKEKVLALNNNIACVPHRATELFIDTEQAATTGYFNPLLGYNKINQELLGEMSHFINLIYRLQDPALHVTQPVYNIGLSTAWHSIKTNIGNDWKPVFYDIETAQMLTDFGIDVDRAGRYGFYQGGEEEVITDFELYNYQGSLYMQRCVLDYLYDDALHHFSPAATDYRFSAAECKPRASSLGPSHPKLRAIKQDAVYKMATDEDITDLIRLASTTPLAFTTKVVSKFALSAKARARTIASCSMFASTLFRALHKPVTAKFVQESQTKGSHFHSLIGVSKFYCKFSDFVTERYGDVESYNVFGADYTKCDRSFPLVFRGLTAAILFELGGHDPEGYLFVNEIMAFMVDFALVGNSLAQKFGGTSSGDATTAFSNTIYNHVVNKYLQLIYFASHAIPGYEAISAAACATVSGYGHEVYQHLSDTLGKYHLNFLSDDSFILIAKDAPQIYTPEYFSRILATLIHTQVDEKKSWYTEGHIEEFCSSTIVNVNGKYQFQPEQDRLVASLLIRPKLDRPDMQLVRFAAILLEAGIFYHTDKTFWDSLFSCFRQLVNKFLSEHGLLPIPQLMTQEEFYINMLEGENAYSDLAEELFQRFEIELQAATYCVGCPNTTSVTCRDCPVKYPVCSYCAYTHFVETGHNPNTVLPCDICGETLASELFVELIDGKPSPRCSLHVSGFAIPIISSGQILMPLMASHMQHDSQITAISDTEFQDFDYCQWRSQAWNCLRLMHNSYLLETGEEPVCSYVVDNCTIIPLTPEGKDPLYGFTTYVNILSARGHTVCTATLDPLGNGRYSVYFSGIGIPLHKFKYLKRTEHRLEILPSTSFNLLAKAKFIIGPPGTGKTYYIKENYFKHATLASPVVYTAPMHKLVQGIDQDIADLNAVVKISKGNNRKYLHPTDGVAPIYLSTCNTAGAVANSTLVVDEVSLLNPLQLFILLRRAKPLEVILLGDPYQLAPVTPRRDFAWSFKEFWIRQFVQPTNISHLSVCYRCPTNVLRAFSHVYIREGIQLSAAREGGQFEIKVIEPRLNKDMIDTGILDLAASKHEVTLCNYKAAAVYGASVGKNIITIDSSQGLTFSSVAVVVFGTTAFSKVINRAIVALSRATEKVTIYAQEPVIKFYSELFQWASLESAPVTTELPDVGSTVIFDAEFYHVRTPNKCTLTLGHVAVMTTLPHTTFLAPRINGQYQKNFFTPPRWRYMLKKCPTPEASEYNLTRLIMHIANTTVPGKIPIFVLYNGTTDKKALSEYYQEPATCYCGQPAYFHGDQSWCHTHAVNPTKISFEVYDLIGSSLEVEHSKYCNVNHGTAHNPLVDVAMTACIFSHMYIEEQPQKEVMKAAFASKDPANRQYGSKLLVNTYVVPVPHSPCLIVPQNHDHSIDMIRTFAGLRCPMAEPGLICKNCHTHYKTIWENSIDLGYEYTTPCILQTPAFNQYKLHSEVITKDQLVYVNVKNQPNNQGVLLPFFQSLEQTIYRHINNSNKPLPPVSVIQGLGITHTYEVAHPALPIALEVQPHFVLLTTKVVEGVKEQYVLDYNTLQPGHGSFIVGIDSLVPFVNTTGRAQYVLKKYINGQLEEMPHTLFSTGRLANNKTFLFADEQVMNVHIDEGEVHGRTIGGLHSFPIAFQDLQYRVAPHQPGAPFCFVTVLKETGTKLTSAHDVHNVEFYNQVQSLANGVSCKTTITIDYQQVEIMIWGNVQTAYLQAGGPDDQDRRTTITDSFIEWHPYFYPDLGIEQVENHYCEYKQHPKISLAVQLIDIINKIGCPAKADYTCDDPEIDIVFKTKLPKAVGKAALIIDTDPRAPLQIENLKLGGIYLKFSDGTDYNSKFFKEIRYFTPRIMGGTSVLVVALIRKLPTEREEDIQFNRVQSILNYKKGFVVHIRETPLELDTQIKPMPCVQVPSHLLSLLSAAEWSSGRFLE